MHRSTRLMHATDSCVVNGGSSLEGLTKAVFSQQIWADTNLNSLSHPTTTYMAVTGVTKR